MERYRLERTTRMRTHDHGTISLDAAGRVKGQPCFKILDTATNEYIGRGSDADCYLISERSDAEARVQHLNNPHWWPAPPEWAREGMTMRPEPCGMMDRMTLIPMAAREAKLAELGDQANPGPGFAAYVRAGFEPWLREQELELCKPRVRLPGMPVSGRGVQELRPIPVRNRGRETIL